jgi:hypothetical protein
VVEQPAGAGQDVGLVMTDFIDHHPDVFVDGSRYDFPFPFGAILYLSMQSGQGQGGMGVRTIEVYPKNLHETCIVLANVRIFFLSLLLVK